MQTVLNLMNLAFDSISTQHLKNELAPLHLNYSCYMRLRWLVTPASEFFLFASLPGFYSGTGSATYTNTPSPSCGSSENCKLRYFCQMLLLHFDSSPNFGRYVVLQIRVPNLLDHLINIIISIFFTA